MYYIKESGSIKYIYKDGVKITGGHQTFYIRQDGAIIGQLGASKEIVIEPDGTPVPNTGSDEIERKIRLNTQAVMDRLNEMDEEQSSQGG